MAENVVPAALSSSLVRSHPVWVWHPWATIVVPLGSDTAIAPSRGTRIVGPASKRRVAGSYRLVVARMLVHCASGSRRRRRHVHPAGAPRSDRRAPRPSG